MTATLKESSQVRNKKCLRGLLKNHGMQGNKELLNEPYNLVRRGKSDKVDEALRVFQRPLKCQFHSHAHGDPLDHISYSPKSLIDEAAKLKYDVLSITCHRKILFTKNLSDYAKKKGILLIPGIEFEINKRHILCINAHEDIYKVENFDNLKQYRKSHPESLIIAPHPFFPGPSLGKFLPENIKLFDAIEISWAYTKLKNYNKKAIALAKKHKLPLLATADCHILRNLDVAYTMVNSKKDIQSIFTAIKDNKIENFHKPTNIFKILHDLGNIVIKTRLKKLL